MKKVYNEHRFSDFRELINHSYAEFQDCKAFIMKNSDATNVITYAKLREDYYSLCTAFLKMGLSGKRIAIIGNNCYEWVLSYLAASTVGVAVPLDKELSSADIINFTDSAEATLICGDEKSVSKIEDGIQKSIDCITFTEIKELTVSTDADYSLIDGIDISRGEMQVLLFTSGTTGYSKGVCLSQYNILSDIHSTVSIVRIKSSDRTMSVLPLHHTYECTLNCLLILSRGACITFSESLLRIQKDMLEYSPSLLVVVPAMLKLFHKRIIPKIKDGVPDRYKRLFVENNFSNAMKKLPFIIRWAVKRRAKQALGGRLRLFIVGAADIDTYIIEDFTAIGIKTLQGYGLTECAPLLTGNSDIYFNPKSAGIAIPGVDIDIYQPNADGVGEIIARGDNIMLGYYNDKEATDAVFTDGWFHTGDLGYLGHDGSLYITGRKKNVIVTENGKNIYPEELEARICVFPEVEEAIVIPCRSESKTEVKAKIFPCIDYLISKLNHIPTLEEIERQIKCIIEEINSKIPDYKRIRLWEILSSSLEKTTTRKVKRFGANLA